MTKAERQTYLCRESQLDGLNLDGLALAQFFKGPTSAQRVFVGACR